MEGVGTLEHGQFLGVFIVAELAVDAVETPHGGVPTIEGRQWWGRYGGQKEETGAKEQR